VEKDPNHGHLATGLPELRHQLITISGRLVRHAGQLTLRLPPGRDLLAEILARLWALPTPP
jgi:hypothetical protein